jgi:anionic cell wall polymer biosynthesis LytR-Cps2A-Psr (LCP) family protein
VRVNFQSVVNIVDALGGITVESDYAFTSSNSLSGTTYTFHRGTNYLTGDKALAFARQRQSLPGGDMQRGVHQQRIITAVLQKLTSSAVVSNFTQVLSAVTDNTKTNISSEDINELIQMQLSDMASWDIQSYAMFGTGITGTLYTFGTTTQYGVLSVPEDQLAEIKDLIQQTLTAHK